MKRSLFGMALAAFLAAPAMAADLARPVYKAPPPAPVTSWSGCYLNAGVGYGFFRQDISSNVTGLGPTVAVSSATSGGSGWLGRVGGGCDLEIAPRWVIGVLGDYDFANLNGTIQPFPILIGSETESSAWAIGGRVGYAVAPSVLSYVEAGYTGARFDAVNLSLAIPGLGLGGIGITSTPANTYSGFFFGGGVEAALNGVLGLPAGFFWRTEYRYADYQSADLNFVLTGVAAPAPLVTEHVRPRTQTVTTSLVWRFNWMGAPVSSRY